jgi:hypothetical protein
LARVLPEAVAEAEKELEDVERGVRRFLPFKLSALRLPLARKDATDAEVLPEESAD